MTQWTSIKLEGLNRTLKDLEMLERKTVIRVTKALKKAGQLVKDESLKETPVDTGALRRSAYGGRTYPVTKSLSGLHTFVGYDSKIAPYATEVHEMPGKHVGKGTQRIAKDGGLRGGSGKMWDTGGKPKFLENALARNTGKVISILNKALRFKIL